MRIALAAATATRTGADATANVPRVTALGTAQVADAQALATANTALVTAQQAAQVALVQSTMEATDAQADADGGVGDTAVEAVDGAGVIESDALTSDGAEWVTDTEDADDDADESVAGTVDTLTVAIAQAAANYQVAQAGAAASAAAATQSATPSAANLFPSQYAAAGYQWAQLFAPQFVSFAQTSADGDKQDEVDDDEADKTLVGDLAQHEQNYEDATAQFDADDATADAEAEIEDARQTTHNDDAYAISAAQADKILAITTAGAQGVDGVAIAQADATQQLEMAQAGIGAPTTAMQTEYNTSIENAKLAMVTTQAGADVIWTGSYTTAGVTDGQADLAADAQDATTEAAADAHDMQHDADAARAANDDDVDSEFTGAGSMLTDATADANAQVGAQETLWSNAAGDNVTVLTTLNTTVGSPLTQYLLDRANAESTWTTTFNTQFSNYTSSVLGAATTDADADALLAKNDAKNDDSAVDLAINAIAGDLIDDADTDVGAVLNYAGSLGSPINGYSGSVANARSQYAIDLAVAQHDYDLGGSQTNYQAALQTALATENGSLRSAAVDYAMSELGPDAQATQTIAAEDLGSTGAVNQAIYTLQTTIDANDKSANLGIDDNDKAFALSAASLAETFTQNTSISYAAVIDNLATTNPNPYSIQAAAIADASNLQTQAGAVATYNQAVAAANAAWTLATTTDTATAAVNDALAANSLAAGNAAALTSYNQIMGKLSSDQAAAAAGGYAAILPPIAMAPGMATVATAFTEIAALGRPALDSFDNIGLGSPPTLYFSGQNAVPPASYFGQSQLGEGLSLGATINLVEHPATLAAPTEDDAVSVVQMIGMAPSLSAPPEIVFLAGDPVEVDEPVGNHQLSRAEAIVEAQRSATAPTQRTPNLIGLPQQPDGSFVMDAGNFLALEQMIEEDRKSFGEKTRILTDYTGDDIRRREQAHRAAFDLSMIGLPVGPAGRAAEAAAEAAAAGVRAIEGAVAGTRAVEATAIGGRLVEGAAARVGAAGSERVGAVAAEEAAAARAIELRPYGGPGGGHHVPAQSAFRRAPGYNPDSALAIPNTVMKSLGIDHTVVSAAQHRLYSAFAKAGQPLTWDVIADIEAKALVEGGATVEQAAATVQRAIQALKDAGVVGPTRIPWGG